MSLLLIDGLRFSYAKSQNLFDNLELEVDPGKIVGLVGPNGCGKSTLIRLIFDLLQKQGGHILIDGHPSDSSDARQASIYLPSDDYLPEFLSGREYIETVCSLYDTPPPEDLPAYFTRYGMQGRENDLIEDYSHGMRKKVQIISALHLSRPFTVIDETFNGIDLDSQIQAEKDLVRLNAKGSTILLCSHDFSLLESITDYVVVMENGRISTEIDTTALKSSTSRLRDVVNDIIFDTSGENGR